MSIFKRISKALEKGKLEARQEAADRQTAKEDRRGRFNEAMDRYDAKEDKHIRSMMAAQERGDSETYEYHKKRAERAVKDRDVYPDPD